jgi:CYTH domain-containing protein
MICKWVSGWRHISGDIAAVAIEGPRTGIARPEFEYEIPIADRREDALDNLSRRYFGGNSVSRRGYRRPWHVDVYCGILQGIALAEIELKEEAQEADPSALGWQGSDRRSVLSEASPQSLLRGQVLYDRSTRLERYTHV